MSFSSAVATSSPFTNRSTVTPRDTINDYQEGAPRPNDLTLDPNYRGFIPIPNTPAFIKFNAKVPLQEEVFTERASIFFKHVRVVRMVDARRNALVYLVYSDKLIDGSPKNSVTAVPVPTSQPIPLQ